MNATEPFGGHPWPLARTVFGHIEERLPLLVALKRREYFPQTASRRRMRAREQARAREALKEALLRGDVHAQGPISRGPVMTFEEVRAGKAPPPVDHLPVAPIDREFWRFAAIGEDGSAVDLSSRAEIKWFEVNAADVLRLWPVAETGEPAAKAPPKQPHGGGAPDRYDWVAVKMALKRECQNRGMPDGENDDIKWRRKAHVSKVLRAEFKREWKEGGPSDSTLDARLGPMLKEIKDELAGN